MLTMNPERSLVSIGVLCEPLHERAGGGDDRFVGVERDDDLDQPHHRNRREEVQAKHALGIRDRRRELGDRDR